MALLTVLIYRKLVNKGLWQPQIRKSKLMLI